MNEKQQSAADDSSRQHVLGFLVAESDLVDGLSTVLQRLIIHIKIRREKHLGVPRKALAPSEIRNLYRQPIVSRMGWSRSVEFSHQPWWAIRVAHIDMRTFFL